MRMHWLRGGVVFAALAFFGCSTATPQPEASDDIRLAESIDVNIADWLDKPRAELADMSDDKTAYLRNQVDLQRSSKDLVELLPDLKPALSPPLFRSVKFSKKLGLSLPPYLAEDVKDREVAWHLARHGDLDAAKKLADPSDDAFLDKLEKLRCERNYPVEWTRLVALSLFDAELKLSRGDPEGAAELVQLHKQLEQVLDSKAKAGPLGAALLPIGRRALALAIPAYREEPFKKNALADDIDAALKEWKDAPPTQPALVVGADKKEIARFFRKPQQGRIFAAPTSTEAVRVLDLLALPIPSEDVDGVIAFLNQREQLAEVLVYYHSNMRQNYPKPVNMAHHLIDFGSVGTEVAESPGVLRQTYLASGQAYQVTVLTKVSSGSAATSALIRIGDTKGSVADTTLPANPRDLGAVNLDRSFEQNRLTLDASMKPGPQLLETSRPGPVERVQQPIRNPKPSSVALTKEADADLLASVALRWPGEVNKEALAKLLVPLWASYGGCRIEGVEDAKDGHLAFSWEADTTRYTLRLPFADTNAPELVVSDRRGTEGLAQRQATVEKFDRTQREAHIKAGKADKRLDRRLTDPLLANITLGMTKADALVRLPKSQKIRQTDIADGVSLYFFEPPDKLLTHSPRQVWVRFGPNERVAEIRVRYVEGPAKPTRDKPLLYDWLRRDPQGEPDTLVSRWSGLWTDLPKKGGAASLYRWRDDVTILTYERDANGSEVTLRDRPLDQPNGVTLPPLQYCSRGIVNCQLDEARADVFKHWPTELSKTPDGGFILGQPASSPYDLAVVWFEEDKVARVVARHRQKGALNYNDVPKALQELWSRDLDGLGVIRRQDAPAGQLLQGYGWHDDRTRVRIFGQDSEDGPRLLTEWRAWPLAVKTVATKP